MLEKFWISFKIFCVVSVLEKPKKPIAFKRAVKNGVLSVNEIPKLYIVSVNNNIPQKKEPDKESGHDHSEVGLPPQPKEYLKYPDYDWFWLIRFKHLKGKLYLTLCKLFTAISFSYQNAILSSPKIFPGQVPVSQLLFHFKVSFSI